MSSNIIAFPTVLLTDLLRYLLAAGAAYLFFWVVYERYWQHRRIQRKPVSRSSMWFEFRYSMSTVLIFATIGWGIVTAEQYGYTLIYDRVSEHGWLWWFASVILMILLHDTWFYWTHRLMHHPRVFRHVHLVHHRSTRPSPWAAYSFHPIEAIVEAGIFPLIVFTIPSHHSALFVFLIYMIVRNVLGHLGIEFLPAWFLQNKWINWHTTTTHHDMHHKYFNANYGLYFTWWDRWMGTEHKEYHETFDEVTSRRRHGHKQTWIQKIFMVVLFSLSFSYLTAQQHSVAGTWQTFHDKTGLPLAQIEIDISGGTPTGRIVKLFLQPWEGEDPVCTFCPGDHKDQKVLGMEILGGLRKDGNLWSGGHILDPASGKMYDCRLWMENDTTIKLQGFGGPLNLVSRTQTWTLHQKDHDSDPVTGIWKQIDDVSGLPKSLVDITRSGDTISGRVLKIFLLPWEGEDPVCTQCPGLLKDRKVVGMTILHSFEYDKGRWTGGRILDPANGKTYKSSMWLINADTLKIRGYWGPLFRTQTWRRATTDQLSPHETPPN